MSNSKKLALAQTILLTIQMLLTLPLSIVHYFYNLEGFLRSFTSSLVSVIVSVLVLIILLSIFIASFVLAIIQIVTASKNNEEKIYLIAGVLALVPFTTLGAIVCNMIGLYKHKDIEKTEVSTQKEEISKQKDNVSRARRRVLTPYVIIILEILFLTK